MAKDKLVPVKPHQSHPSSINSDAKQHVTIELKINRPTLGRFGGALKR